MTPMSSALWHSIRYAREAKGWDQGELARRLRVSQQTVSRWERGQARPRSDVLAALSSALGIELDDIVAASAERSREATASGAVPVAPLVPTLPVDKLPWDRFEHFVADLAHQLYRGADAHLVGGQGHTQDGIDVAVQDSDRIVATFQCKRHAEFGPAKVAAAVEAVDIEAQQHHIVLARVASPQARKEIAKHPAWRLWDIHDVARIVRTQLDREAAIRLVDTYFPGWRERFLGVRSPGAWLTPGDFARPLTTSGLFTHRWPLVGRDEALDAIRGRLMSGMVPAALVVGRGGIGKTRLLIEVARQCEDAGSAVRFLGARTVATAEAVEQLPDDADLIVVIDDAHDRDGLGEILAALRRYKASARVVLGLRPYGELAVAEQLRRAGIDAGDCFRWQLEDLTPDDASRLAAEVLSDQTSRAIARRVGELAPDCPLIVVLAARLIRDGRLNPTSLETDEEVRSRVLGLFHDVLVDSGSDSVMRRDVLGAIAATQPFRVSDPESRRALEQLVGEPYDRILPLIRGLEDAGVMLRRGNSLRIVPDLLGDVILARACYDEHAGIATGYLGRVREAADHASLRNLFVNASRLDWQIGTGGRRAPSLADELWDLVDREFEDAGIGVRLDLLEVVERAAIYRPDRALRLARWAAVHPTHRVEHSELTAVLPTPTYDRVLHQLPAVLRQVVVHPDHLRDGVDLLWDLAQADDRPPHAHPDHALRVLTDLAAIQPGKPLRYTIEVVSAVARWLDASPPGVRSPFDVLDEVLSTEGFTVTSTPRAVQLTPFLLDPDQVRDVRAKVVDLALREAASQDPRRAVRGVKAIEGALHYPVGMGQPVSPSVRDRWMPDFADGLRRLRPIAAQPADPVVAIAIRRALRWHAGDGGSDAHSEAQATLAALPTDLVHEIALALHDGWGHLVDGLNTDWHEAERARLERFESVAAMAADTYTDDELVDVIAHRLRTDRAVFAGEGHPAPFLRMLARKRPALAGGLSKLAVDDPADDVVTDLPDVLAGLADSDCGADALPLVRRLIATGDIRVVRAAAYSLGWRRSRIELLDDEEDVLTALAAHEDEAVRRSVAHAAGLVARSDRAAAIRLLTIIPFADSPFVAADVLSTFELRAPLRWAELDPSDAQRFLDQLVACPTIKAPEIQQFLVRLGDSQPRAVVDVLTARVDRAADRPEAWREGREPLPYVPHQPFVSAGHPERPVLLAHVRDWIASHAESSTHRYWGPMVFGAIAGEYDDTVLDVIERGLSTPTEASVAVAASILRSAPRTLALDRVEFVRRVLAAGEAVGGDAANELGGALHIASTNGLRTGIPGQPFQDDVEQRDRAEEIAATLPGGSIEQRFYRSLARSATDFMRWASEIDDKQSDHRDW
jgi:transcriptional regulator with XRE-family HTH domain